MMAKDDRGKAIALSVFTHSYTFSLSKSFDSVTHVLTATSILIKIEVLRRKTELNFNVAAFLRKCDRGSIPV